MTAQLNFNLDNPEDFQKYNRFDKSLDLVLCLFDIRELIVRNSKINQKQFFEILSSYNIEIEELTS